MPRRRSSASMSTTFGPRASGRGKDGGSSLCRFRRSFGPLRRGEDRQGLSKEAFPKIPTSILAPGALATMRKTGVVFEGSALRSASLMIALAVLVKLMRGPRIEACSAHRICGTACRMGRPIDAPSKRRAHRMNGGSSEPGSAAFLAGSSLASPVALPTLCPGTDLAIG